MAVLWRSEAAEAATETHAGGPQSPASTESPGGPSIYYTFSGELWQYDGEAPLGFVMLPAELSQDIRAKHGRSATSVGSINVLVTVGATHWATSLFPVRSHGCYVLPIQKSVRAAERLVAGSPVEVRLQLH